MGKSLREKLNQLSQDRQDKIRQQAEQWIAEDPILQDLRSNFHATTVQRYFDTCPRTL